MGTEGYDKFEQDDEEEVEEEEVVEEMTEKEIIEMLDSEMDPHTRCSQVFLDSDVSQLKMFTAAAVTSLRKIGIAILDEAPGSSETADVLRQMCTTARADGSLRPAGLEEHDAAARGDEVVWLSKAGDPPRAESAKECGPGRMEVPSDSLVATLLSNLDADVELAAGLSARERQLAAYAPGTCGYDRHRDSLPSAGPRKEPSVEDGGIGTQRCLTSIMYCVENDWAGTGGRLRVWLSGAALKGLPASGLQDNAPPGVDVTGSDNAGLGEDGAHIAISPRRGRLVMFLAGALDHCVEPCQGCERVAMTTWYH